MTLTTMPSSPSNRRPRCPCPSTYSPSKRSRHSNSTLSHTSIQPPVTPIHKRHRPARTYQPQLSHYRGPGPPLPIIMSPSLSSSSSSSSTSLSSTTTCSFINKTNSPNRDSLPLPTKRSVELPDEVLVAIFRFIDHASKLARLRTVCKQWCKVIDDTPHVWRMVSFKNADFSQPVARLHSSLVLARRPGERAVATAARSGNEWARFLKHIIFDRHKLSAVTIPQPIASLLVSGERPVDTRPFPPWHHGDMPDSGGTWVAIHAARRAVDGLGATADNQVNGEAGMGVNGSVYGSAGRGMVGGIDVAKLPCGAMVGIIHVRHAFQTTAADNNSSAPRWIWSIDRAVRLKKPVRCAGFVGLWTISGFLTDFLVNAMHKQ